MNLKIRPMLFILLFLLALSSANALAQACCIQPTSETTAVAGTFNTTMSQFNQAVSDTSGSNFDGMNVREGIGAPGSDTCWFSGSAIPPINQITGGTWPVAGADVPGQHNHWGYDTIGVSPAVVDYYRVQAPAHGHPIPCGFTVWQSMAIQCLSNWQIYTSGSGNRLTATINASTVVNCRNDMSGSACQTITY